MQRNGGPHEELAYSIDSRLGGEWWTIDTIGNVTVEATEPYCGSLGSATSRGSGAATVPQSPSCRG